MSHTIPWAAMTVRLARGVSRGPSDAARLVLAIDQ
jgi:hypothetical protein